MDSGNVIVGSPPEASGNPHSVNRPAEGHGSPIGWVGFPLEEVSDRITHPGAIGPSPGLQIPSFSNPNSSASADTGSEEIGLEELFCTPIRASSIPSNGPWDGSDWTVVSVSVIVNRN